MVVIWEFVLQIMKCITLQLRLLSKATLANGSKENPGLGYPLYVPSLSAVQILNVSTASGLWFENKEEKQTEAPNQLYALIPQLLTFVIKNIWINATRLACW